MKIGYERADQIESAMRAVAPWIASDRDVKIKYHGGTRVSADIFKKILHLPRFGTLDNDSLMKYRAWLYHEAGHIRETKLTKEEYPKKKALHKIFNSLEDIRMQRRVAEKFAGAGMAFRFATEFYNKEIGKKAADGQINTPLWESTVAMGFQADGFIPSWKLSEKAQRYFDLAYPIFAKINVAKSAQDALEIAEKIYEILKEEKQKDKDEQQEEQGEEQQEEQGEEQGEEQQEAVETEMDGETTEEDEWDDEDDSGSDSEDESKSDGEDEGEDESDGDGGSGGNNSDDQSEKSNEVGGNKNKNSNSEDDSENDGESDSEGSDEDEIENELDEEAEGDSFEDKLADEIENAIEELDPLDREYYPCKDNDVFDVPNITSVNCEQFRQRRQRVAASIMGMSRALEQALRTMSRCRKNPNRESGKLDMNKLVDVAKSLSSKVFYNETEGRNLDVACSIAIDESGSMREYFNVQLLAIALGETLNSIGVPFEIVGATTKYFSGNRGMPPLDGFTRTNPIIYKCYKTFMENWMSVRPRITMTNCHKHHIDGEVVEMLATRLSHRHEKRKVIFSLSDGLPQSGHRGNIDELMARNLKRVCERAREYGIEVYGFGLETMEPERYYGKDYFVYLNNIAEMSSCMFFRRFANIITKGCVKI